MPAAVEKMPSAPLAKCAGELAVNAGEQTLVQAAGDRARLMNDLDQLPQIVLALLQA